MTQTLLPQPEVRHAMVVMAVSTGLVNLHRFPVVSVEEARDEFGGTLADALLFVDGVCCTECGTEASETRETSAFARVCRSCGAGGCACTVFEDPHARDVFFCSGCMAPCLCRECAD
ncbi:hypothetical protein [Longimicrobium sp.]|jgi:hypothetical protein|uniref:hypothetical protein n=1 Tax=Longimicrobium sp. TaxID=2029185 RepID=UPI002EDA959F